MLVHAWVCLAKERGGQSAQVMSALLYQWPFLYSRRIMRLDEFGQAFVVRLVIRHQYRDGNETHWVSRRTMLCSSS